MNIPAEFRVVAYDTAPMAPSGGVTELFGARPDGPSADATATPEDVLVSTLLAIPVVRALVMRELGLPMFARHWCKVTKPFIANARVKPGDIDLLLVDPRRPDAASAIECKRVKVRPSNRGEPNQRINRLERIAEALTQANALATVGFANTYVALLIVTDGRDSPEESFVFRGADRSVYRRLYEAADWAELRAEVGLLLIEVAQPVHRSLEQAGVVAIAVPKRPTPQAQGTRLTGLLREALSRP